MNSQFLQWLYRVSALPCQFHLEGSAVTVSKDRELGLMHHSEFQSFQQREPRSLIDASPAAFSRAIGDAYSIPAEAIIPTVNASLALYVVCHSLLVPGDDVLVEHPVYDPFLVAPVAASRARVHPFSRSTPEYGIDFQSLAATLETLDRPRMIICSNLHNPSGAQMGQAAHHQMVELAERFDLTIVIDEVFRDLAPPFDILPTPAGAQSRRLITVNSFSKVYGWSDVFRCGWIITSNPARAAAIRESAGNLYNALSPIDFFLGALALKDLPGHRSESVGRVAQNREAAQRFFAPLIEDGLIEVDIAPYSSICFPRILFVDDTEPLTQQMDTAGVRVAPGRYFGAPQNIRIGLGGEVDKLDQGLRIFSDVLRKAHQAFSESI